MTENINFLTSARNGKWWSFFRLNCYTVHLLWRKNNYIWEYVKVFFRAHFRLWKRPSRHNGFFGGAEFGILHSPCCSTETLLFPIVMLFLNYRATNIDIFRSTGSGWDRTTSDYTPPFGLITSWGAKCSAGRGLMSEGQRFLVLRFLWFDWTVLKVL